MALRIEIRGSSVFPPFSDISKQPLTLPGFLLTSFSLLQQSFVGAIAVADLVKTTLGPKGMDKILQSMGDEHARKKITVTNDGATIL